MFTGIVQVCQPIDAVHILGASELQTEPNGLNPTVLGKNQFAGFKHSRRIEVRLPFSDVEIGESIAFNGVCLTVEQFNPSNHASKFLISPETLNVTSLGQLRAGSLVNIERALQLQTRISGHIVQGHVDGLATVISLEPYEQSGCFRLLIELDKTLSKHCVKKGSITVNGVSLTINELEDLEKSQSSRVSIMLIPHTFQNTQFKDVQPGHKLNIETDILAKHVERLLRFSEPRLESHGEITQ